MSMNIGPMLQQQQDESHYRFRQKVPNIVMTVYESNGGVGGTWFTNRYPVSGVIHMCGMLNVLCSTGISMRHSISLCESAKPKHIQNY